MAVLIEGISVVVRCSEIMRGYEGGAKGFANDVPNNTLRADGMLAAVTLLHPIDVQAYVEKLGSKGMKFRDKLGALDIVVVDQRTGFCFPCGWAFFGRTYWDRKAGKEVAVCAMGPAGHREIVVPEGWNFDQSLSASHHFIDERGLPSNLRLIRREGELDVYFDEDAGKEFYSRRSD
jgi:hypothetical protein